VVRTRKYNFRQRGDAIDEIEDAMDAIEEMLRRRHKSRSIYNAGWSSLVARRAHNPKVVSSNLTPATILRNTT
jgi:hypothetical protein